MTSSFKDVGDDYSHPNDLAIIPVSLPPREAIELETGDHVATINDRKRKSSRVTQTGSTAEQEKLDKMNILSLMKPSYVLGLHPDKLRSQHEGMLRKLLHKLLNQQNWVEASGVLSVYLQATVKEMSPIANQFKFSALLGLLEILENGNIKKRITNLFDVWMRKNGSIKDKPAAVYFHAPFPKVLVNDDHFGKCLKNRYTVHLDLILFLMMQGNIQDAYDVVLCLKQVGADHDPITNMVMGLVFYETWYSRIPKEFQWRDSEQCIVKDSETSVDVDIDQEIDLMEMDVNHQKGKATSNFQPQSFYLDSDSEELWGDGDNGLNNGFYVPNASSLYTLKGLDSWLFPLHIPDHNSFENFINMHNELLNDRYRDAVSCLQKALHSTPPALAAFLPLIQLLLIGGQIVEALNVVEKQCCTSASVFPLRLKSILLEQFNPNNFPLIASCCEEVLKKDPTCCESLAKLIKMHKAGNYSVERLIDMTASHLDVSNAERDTWKLFAGLFKDVYRRHNSTFKSSTPQVFTKKSWSVRCRWWSNLHFSRKLLKSGIEAGDLRLLTYKAACASYMYGKEYHYVVGVYCHLEKNGHDLLRFLDKHRQNSYGLCQ